MPRVSASRELCKGQVRGAGRRQEPDFSRVTDGGSLQILKGIPLSIFVSWCLRALQFSLVMSNFLRPHELQHARPPCPTPTPGVHSNSCPLSRWCHPAISSSVVPSPPAPNPSEHQVYVPSNWCDSIMIFALFWWFGTELSESPRHTRDCYKYSFL